MSVSWRDRARPIIAAVLAQTSGASEKEICSALRAAYPFGERKYHPYKIWLNEIKRQRHPETKWPLQHPTQTELEIEGQARLELTA